MNKITYLFGAGASKHALPIVEEMPKKVEYLIQLLEMDMYNLSMETSFTELNLAKAKSKRHYQLEMITSLKWMMAESKNHASIDTFAKKLYIKQRYDELKRLKVAMSVFFVFEQARNKPDYRYDSFFASLISRLNGFPEHVRILSWNYDYQFELSYSEYSENNEISSNQAFLNVNSKFEENIFSKNTFGIYKLNGTTGFMSGGRGFINLFATNLNVPFDINLIEQIVKNFATVTYIDDLYSSLSFAWENENSQNNILNRAVGHTCDTHSLVIIGYSFPFFNRELDRKIIGNMNQLKRVYFQAPDADNLKERFLALCDDVKGIELLTRFDVGQFLLPNEL